MAKDHNSIIKVIGVGGGGSNAVNHMFSQGISGVDFIVCNTDKQALDISPVNLKLQLGTSLTDGLGAGSIPERGKDSAHENIEDIRSMLQDRTKMVFITAGMGGGTGTGAAPVIAATAKEMGILTVGIVTVPFQWEGKKRRKQAMEGIEDMRKNVDTLLIINNDKLRELYGNLSLDNAFGHADDVLTTAARGIAEIMTKTGKVNVDFEDVKTVMTNSGQAIMGMSECEGEGRAVKAAEAALSSPLLNDNDIVGARHVLLNIAYGAKDVMMDEITDITDHIQDAAGDSADVIWGYCHDETCGESLRVTLIATGFNQTPDAGIPELQRNEKKITHLDADVPTMITAPIVNPLNTPLPNGKPPVVQPPSIVDENEPYLKESEDEPVEDKEQITLDFQPPATPEPFSVNEPAQQVEPEPTITDTPTSSVTVVDRSNNDDSSERKVFNLDDEVTGVEDTSAFFTEKKVPEDHPARVTDRLENIRANTLRLRTPNGLSELENEPAYKRKNVDLTSIPHSSESSVSRYTLSEEEDSDGDRTVELKKNNPFLHDNVD